MAFPIHPSRSDYDLMYSVLYDDFTAENAIQIIAILDKEEPFPDPPAPSYKVKVTYKAAAGGSLQGGTTEWVQAGASPTQVPMVTTDRGYVFSQWTVDGVPVNPESVVVTKDTVFTAEFTFQGIYYDVMYEAGPNGSVDGVLTEHVPEGTLLTFPNPEPNAGYLFYRWVDDTGKAVDPETETATRDAIYTAEFQVERKVFTIDIYDVKPRTTASGSSGITHHQYQVNEGDAVSLNMFVDTSAGPTINAAGEYMDSFDEVPTKDTWYQRIDNTEQLSTQNYYYRKTFYAGRGGKLRSGTTEGYALTMQGSTWGGGSITTPTPVADTGWHFSHWINLATGATVSNPSSGTTTAKYGAIFVQD